MCLLQSFKTTAVEPIFYVGLGSFVWYYPTLKGAEGKQLSGGAVSSDVFSIKFCRYISSTLTFIDGRYSPRLVDIFLLPAVKGAADHQR